MPENTGKLSRNFSRFAGAVIVTVGGRFSGSGGGGASTLTLTELEAGTPTESETAAVRVCVPAESSAWKLPPLPIAPSALEVHVRLAVRSPSSGSLAEPATFTSCPSGTLVPLSGELIMMLGGAFPGTWHSTGREKPLTGVVLSAPPEIASVPSPKSANTRQIAQLSSPPKLSMATCRIPSRLSTKVGEQIVFFIPSVT